jgi:hypothetical protein
LGELTFHWVDTSPGAAGAFPNLELRTEFFKTVSKPASVFLEAQGGLTVGYDHCRVSLMNAAAAFQGGIYL